MELMVAILLHGWPVYRLDDYFLVKHLQNSGYEVIAPNMFSRNYVFSPANVQKEIDYKLNGRKPDIIIGISLGGLVAPYIAKEYPDSKLTFISSGPSLKSKSSAFNSLITFSNTKMGSTLLPHVIKLPDSYLTFFYKVVNPFMGDKTRIKKYNDDTSRNIKFIKSITIDEEKEILDFIANVDNTELLSKLPNKSLIFSGENDRLMSKEQGEVLNKLLKNSQLIVNNGSHFDSFTEEDLAEIDKFIQSTILQ